MAQTSYLEHLLSSAPPSPLFPTSTRQAATQAAREFGLPGRHIEGWRYMPVRRLEQAAAAATGANDAGEVEALIADLPQLGPLRLVFVDGKFSEPLSLWAHDCEGLRIGSLAKGLPQTLEPLEPLPWRDAGDTFACVNAAIASDGIYVDVADNVAVADPIHLVVVGDREPAAHLHSIVRLGAGAHVELVEHFVSTQQHTGLSNCVNQVSLDSGSRMRHVRIQQAGSFATVLVKQHVAVAEDATYAYFGEDLGGDLVRNDLTVALNATGAHCDLSGVYLTDAGQLVDNHLTVEHNQPGASSNMAFKGVLNGKSTGVFNGRVLVQKGADGTDANQSNDNLILSRDAQINTKPELEIYADDVKCAHGTTVGQLDEAALFYLRSRGIPRRAARNLLTYAFCTELLEALASGTLKDYMIAALVENLPEPEALEDIA